MKTCIRTILTAVCLFFAFSGAVFADGTYIASGTNTSAVKFGEGEYEVVGDIATNGLAITKDGYLIISSGAEGEITVTDGSAESELKVLPPLKYDFESNAVANENVTFSGETTVVDNENCADGGELEVSALGFSGGTFVLEFDFNKPDTTRGDLLKLYDSLGNVTAHLKLYRQVDEVYLVYMDEASELGWVFCYDSKFAVGEWNSVKAIINLDTKVITFTSDNETVSVPLKSASLAKIGFGTLVDNIIAATGAELTQTALEIGLESISVPATGSYEIDPAAKIKIGNTMHAIDSKYLTFAAEGTGIVSRNGKILLDSEKAEATVTVSVGAIVSDTEFTAEKSVTVTKNAAAGTACSTLAVYEPTVVDGKIQLRVLNGNGMNLKIVMSRVVDGGAMEYTSADWAVDSNDCSKEIDLPGDGTTVYLIDTVSKADLLR